MSDTGALFVVGTPIGNLEDITLRALRVLKEVDVIFCEDTRVTAKLLARYEIKKPLVRCDEKQELAASKKAIDLLSEGKSVALVTDAGTPGISDPGTRLVREVRDALGASVSILAIPGPSAITAALSIAGVNAREFLFLGFLPHKKGRQTALKSIADSTHTVVLYESPHRILKLCRELRDHIGDREIFMLRELTKTFESRYKGSAGDIAAQLEAAQQDRGEFVVIVPTGSID